MQLQVSLRLGDDQEYQFEIKWHESSLLMPPLIWCMSVHQIPSEQAARIGWKGSIATGDIITASSCHIVAPLRSFQSGAFCVDISSPPSHLQGTSPSHPQATEVTSKLQSAKQLFDEKKDVLQRTAQWRLARLMTITATRANCIVHGRPPIPSVTLMKQLLGIARHVNTEPIRFGVQNEERCLSHFESVHDCQLTRGLFMRHPLYPWIACSPDGFSVSQIVEIKCLSPPSFPARLSRKFLDQCQHILMVLERPSMVLLMYNGVAFKEFVVNSEPSWQRQALTKYMNLYNDYLKWFWEPQGPSEWQYQISRLLLLTQSKKVGRKRKHQTQIDLSQ